MHHVMKDCGYSPLIGSFGIFEIEGHDNVIKVANGSSKGYLGCIFG